MVRSKLNIIAYLYTFLILSFPFIITYFILKINEFTKGSWSWGVIAFVSFLVLLTLAVVVWGVFIEMNMRMPVIEIHQKKIKIKMLLGFGAAQHYDFSDIDGYIVKSFRSRGKTHEYLYLIQNKKPLAVFSSLYFKNYDEVKKSFADELREYGAA